MTEPPPALTDEEADRAKHRAAYALGKFGANGTDLVYRWALQLERERDELRLARLRVALQLERIRNTGQKYDAVLVETEAAREALDDLESELAEKTARVEKPLAWRDPSQAPTNTVALVVMAAFGTIAMGERTRHSGWRVNEAQCPEHWIAGWLPLDALPPAPTKEGLKR